MSRINLSEEDANKTQSRVGPIRWMAPECIKESKYSTKSDVWAFGITIVEIVTQQKPYPYLQLMEVVSYSKSFQLRIENGPQLIENSKNN